MKRLTRKSEELFWRKMASCDLNSRAIPILPGLKMEGFPI